MELIALCQRLGATLIEFPVCWRDMPGSTFSVPRHSAAALRDVAAIWLNHRPGRAGAAPAVTLAQAGDPLALQVGAGLLAAGHAVPGTGQALPTGVTGA